MNRAEEWLVVNRSRKIPGGYRVAKAKLTKEEAVRWAASYKRPHQAMSMEELLRIRTEALRVLADGFDVDDGFEI